VPNCGVLSIGPGAIEFRRRAASNLRDLLYRSLSELYSGPNEKWSSAKELSLTAAYRSRMDDQPVMGPRSVAADARSGDTCEAGPSQDGG
jgi:hypothetical protein